MNVLPAAVLLLLVISQQAGTTCADAASCRAAALEAQTRKDYEAFHDLAWLAYRKGNANDPELMLLLARAQSLSGRPSDALVMLQRIAARGVTTDAATSEDFARVRALPRWKELFGQSSSDPRAPTPEPRAPTPDPRAPIPDPRAPSPGSRAPIPEPRTPSPEPRVPSPGSRAPSPEPRAPSPGGKARVSFTTSLTPTALAYDAVSKRYVIADRESRRIAIVDENTGHVSTLAGTQASLGEIGGIAIDPAQGDLWVISSSSSSDSASSGATLHRLQLISGRVLAAVPVSGSKARIVALAFVRGVGLVAADSSGGLSKVSPRGRLDAIGALEYVPRTMAADTAGRLYVSPGGPRIARFMIDPHPGAREVLTLPDEAVIDGGFAIARERLHFLSQRDGQFEIRAIPLRR